MSLPGETFEQKLRRVLSEQIVIAPYNPDWPRWFDAEKQHLRNCLPKELIGRIEHFGSTAVPGLAAKPIVDMLVEVASLAETQVRIAPLLEGQGYDYFWRPTRGNDQPPFYAWFIKRDPGTGARTHHIHMVEAQFEEHWERLLFRDYLRANAQAAYEYEALKVHLSARHAADREAYTEGKTAFILEAMERARALKN
jgi:GrpB-like predicted nucleotidyltransferase (UPF0157 family)